MTPPAASQTLAGCAYELGEVEASYRDLPGFGAAIAGFGLVDDATVWGWGSVFLTRRSRGALAAASARRSLAGADVGPGDVDAVIFCAAEFPGDADAHGAISRDLLGELQLGHAALIGLTLARCNTMLAGIELAARLTAAGAFGAVLVVASDAVADEGRRFRRHALFSDAAASCLLLGSGTRGPGAFAVLDAVSRQEPARMTEEADVGGDLGRAVNAAVEARTGVPPRAVARVLHANLFLPIVKIREQLSGFAPRQLFLGNVARRAHCFSADPIVNLCDCMAGRAFTPGERVALASSVPGARTVVLAEAT